MNAFKNVPVSLNHKKQSLFVRCIFYLRLTFIVFESKYILNLWILKNLQHRNIGLGFLLPNGSPCWKNEMCQSTNCLGGSQDPVTYSVHPGTCLAELGKHKHTAYVCNVLVFLEITMVCWPSK